MRGKHFAVIAFSFCLMMASGHLVCAWAMWQEGDLIKERISLAPRQKNALEKYEAPGTEQTSASQPQKEKTGNRATPSNRSKQDSPSESSLSNKPTNSVSTSTATVYPTPSVSRGTLSSITTPISEPIKEQSAFESFWLSPGKFLSRGFELFVVIGGLLVVVYLAMQKFRGASSE